jgi:predicted CXXCH cytochrome family protein
MRVSSKRYVVGLAVGFIALALAALPVAVAGGRAPAESPATYVESATCQACHKPVGESWAATAHGKALSDATLPEGKGGCEACHGPGSAHAGTAGKRPLLKFGEAKPEQVVAVCGKCHLAGKAVPGAPQLDPAAWKQSGHAASKTSCVKCHRGHAPEAAPEKLCLGCHSNLTKPPAGGKVHAPVKAGQCLTCHDPHGTAGAHSLTPKVSTKCEQCHSTAGGKLDAAHKGYAVAGSDCTRCHDAHSFDAEHGYVKKVAHPPFAQQNCTICHVDKPSTDLRKSVSDTCLACHPKSSVLPEKDAEGKELHAHPPVAGGLCTSCHEPHASDTAEGLRDDPLYVCASCHRKVGTEARGATYQHPPVAKGECLSCHKGHASVQRQLLTKDEATLCKGCHESQAMHAHPIGPEVKDSNTGEPVQCVSCHAIHGSEHAFILPQEQTAMCLSCHRMEP